LNRPGLKAGNSEFITFQLSITILDANIWGSQIFQKSRRNLKILGARNVTCNNFHTGKPQALGDTGKIHMPG